MRRGIWEKRVGRNLWEKRKKNWERRVGRKDLGEKSWEKRLWRKE